MHLASKLHVQVKFLQGLALLGYQHATASSYLQATESQHQTGQWAQWHCGQHAFISWPAVLPQSCNSTDDLRCTLKAFTPRLKGCKCAISSKISFMSLISLISLTSSVQCWTFTSRCSPGSARRALNKNAHMHPAFPPFWASYVLMLAFVLHAHILPFNLSCGSVFRCVSWLVFWYVHITLPYNL